MEKTSGIVVLSLVAAGAAAALVLSNVVSEPGVATFSSTAIDDRLFALEAAVSEERQARQLLEDELLALYAEIERLEANQSYAASDAGNGDSDESDADQVENSTEAVQVTAGRGSRGDDSAEDRRAAMIQAGMSPERADLVLRRESEMRFEMMQAFYEARSSGENFDRFSMNPDALLREEIGDSDYEKYLLANNRSTSVGVANVMASSPAERAGLKAGDEIVGYDGERIFSTTELMQRTMAGGDGDVVVDVVRDGSSMQIVLPRVPIGVETGRFRRR